MSQSLRQQRKANRQVIVHKIPCASRYRDETGSRPNRRSSDRLKRARNGIIAAKKADSRHGGSGYQTPGATKHW